MKWLQKWLGRGKDKEVVAQDETTGDEKTPETEEKKDDEKPATEEAPSKETESTEEKPTETTTEEPAAAAPAPAAEASAELERVVISAELAEEIAKGAASPELAIELLKEGATEEEATAKAFVTLRAKYDEMAASLAEKDARLQALAKAGEETPVSAIPSDQVASTLTPTQAYAEYCRNAAKKASTKDK